MMLYFNKGEIKRENPEVPSHDGYKGVLYKV